MEGFDLSSESGSDIVALSEKLLQEKVHASEEARVMRDILKTDGITPLLQIIVSHALPLL